MADRDDLLRRGCVAILVCLLFTVLTVGAPRARAAPLSAPTFTVNSISDVVASPPLDSGPCETAPGNNTCTLRAAIMKANHWPGGGATILFGPQVSGIPIVLERPASGTDDETVGDLNITQTVTIRGSGASNTIIDGNGSVTHDRVFRIGPGIMVTISGVTIQGGKGAINDGGGLLNYGVLRLNQSAVLSNTAYLGGGILVVGSLTLDDSTIAGNDASGFGGGISNYNSTMAVYSSTIRNNTAGNDGGGIYSANTNTTLLNTAVSANTASGVGGGLVSNGGTATVVNSTVSGNQADADGGGIWNGCYNCPSELNLFNATIANNRADAQLTGGGTGGGVYNRAENDHIVNLQNSLIADNLASDYDPERMVYFFTPNDCYGALTSQRYNQVSDKPTDCTLGGDLSGVISNTSALLGPLQNNGGPTWTHALLPGSTAIDAGNPGGCVDQFGAPLPTDQRGAPRKANGAGTTRCDIGAFELQRTLGLPLVLK